MSTLKYATLYEDVAHKEFLRCLLPQLAQGVKSDTVIEELEIHITASNKKQVDNRCAMASKVAFSDDRYRTRADFFVICRDADSADPKVFKKKNEEFKVKVHTRIRETIICLPVQCIEYWLLYLQQKHANKSLENLPRKEVKKNVYGRENPGRQRTIEVVRSLCTEVDIDWLQSRSVSFREFAANARTVLLYLSE